jgi:UDP-3-O-[3-hydroxymyristoyl] glucosamine N-acyltransferase
MSSQAEGKTVAELAALVGGRVVGDAGVFVRGVASIEGAREGDVAFVEEEKFFEAARSCRASCVIAPDGARLEGVRSVIEVARPKLAFALVAEVLHPQRRREAFVHPTASVASTAKLGAGVYVGAFAAVGEGAGIGEGAQILEGACVGERVTVGRGCRRGRLRLRARRAGRLSQVPAGWNCCYRRRR